MINQGDIYWLDLDEPAGSDPGFAHPHIVVQNNLLNHGRIRTVVTCMLTTNLQRAEIQGNVLLIRGEGGLSEPSVVLVSHLYTVDRSELGEYMGTVSRERIREIVAGIKFVIEPRERR